MLNIRQQVDFKIHLKPYPQRMYHYVILMVHIFGGISSLVTNT